MTYIAQTVVTVGTPSEAKIVDGVFVRKGTVTRFEPGDKVTGLKPAQAKRLLTEGAIVEQKKKGGD